MTVCLCSTTYGQSPDDDNDTQSWNDLQITIPVNKKVDVLLLATLRLGADISRVNEGRFGGGAAFKVHKNFSFSPTYLYIEARNTAGAFRTEHRLNFRGTYKFPVKRIEMSHRSIYEYRFRSSGNSWRYRPSLTLEKSLPKRFLSNAKIFVTEEPFYISTTGRFSRNRITAGVSKTFNDKLTLDVYYTRQNDGNSHPGDLNVIGTSWKVTL